MAEWATATAIVTVDQTNKITVHLEGNTGLFLNLVGALDTTKLQLQQRVLENPEARIKWAEKQPVATDLQNSKHNTQDTEQKVSRADALAAYYLTLEKVRERIGIIASAPDDSLWAINPEAIKSL